MRPSHFLLLACGLAQLIALPTRAAVAPARQTISLNGDWQFQRDGAAATEWKTVPVPSSFESHEGVEFNGVGWYQRKIPAFDLPPGKRVLLHFETAATEAQVWWNGQKLGSHLGGWTPFRFDVTELVRRAPAGQAHEVPRPAG
jgi:beta-galactosidase/beta-glucuronidase